MDMTLQQRAEWAAGLKAAGQCNCTRAVLKAVEDKLPIREGNLDRLSAGFAAGMGCMEGTCGALVGAVMAAGLLSEGPGAPRLAKDILKRFEAASGATVCKDLKGVGTGKVLCDCPTCVRNAVLALGEVLPSAF